MIAFLNQDGSEIALLGPQRCHTNRAIRNSHELEQATVWR